MKRFYRLVSLALTMSILFTYTGFGNVFAEDSEAESVEPVVVEQVVVEQEEKQPEPVTAQTEEKAEVEQPVEEDNNNVEAADMAEVSNEADETPLISESTDNEDPEIVIPEENTESDADELETDSEAPVFTASLSYLKGDSVTVYERDSVHSTEYAKIGSGVVYALELSEKETGNMVRIAFCAEDGATTTILSGWVAEGAVIPMDDEQKTEEYIRNCKSAEGVQYYRNDRNIPLMPLTCELKRETAPIEPLSNGVETESVSVDRTGIKLGVGDTFDLSGIYTVLPADSEDKVTYTASNSVVSVAENGIIKANRYGTSVVTIFSGSQSAQINVTVCYQAASFSVSSQKAVMAIGDNCSLNIKFISKYYGSYTISCEPEGIISVSDIRQGISATAVNDTVSITAEAVSEITDVTVTVKTSKVTRSIKVTVYPAPNTITADDVTVGVGETGKKIQGVQEEGTLCAFRYISLDEDIATVDPETGAITAVSVGDARIEIYATNNTEARTTCTIHVVPSIEKINASVPKVKMGVGDILDVTGEVFVFEPVESSGNLKYTSSNSKVAVVNGNGIVQAKRAGNAVITVTAANGEKNTVKVYVYAAAKSISISTPGQIGEDMAGTITFSMPAGSYALYDYDITPAILSVTEYDNQSTVNKDTIRFRAEMVSEPTEVTIRAIRKKDGAVASTQTVTVYPAPDSIELEQYNYIVGLGDKSKKITATYPENTYCGFNYESEDDSIAYVTENGTIIPVNVGTVNVKVSASNNPDAYRVCTLVIKNASSAVYAQKSTLKVGRFETIDIVYTCGISIDPETAGTYTFKSSSSKIATISSDGVLYAKKKGTCTITVSLNNNPKAIRKIAVKVWNAPTSMSVSASDYCPGSSMEGSLKVTFQKNGYGTYTVNSDYPELISFGSPVYTGAANADTVPFSVGEVSEITEVTVTVKAENTGIEKQIVLTLYPAPESITATESVVVGMGISTAKVIASHSDSTRCNFVFESLDTGVVQVNASNGSLKPVSVGETYVKVTASNNPSAVAMCKVIVKDIARSITVEQSTVTLGIGDVVDIVELCGIRVNEGSSSTFTFASSNKRYASVDSNGFVRALRKGTVTITVKAVNNKNVSKKITVKVLPGATSSALTLSNDVLGSLMNGTMRITFPTGTYDVYSIVSDRPELVSFGTGKYTATGNYDTVPFSVGTVQEKTQVNIDIIGADGKWKNTATITLLPGPAAISVEKSNLTIGKGESGFFAVGMNNEEDTLCNFIYAVSDESVITVNRTTGEISTVSEGDATITVTAENTGAVAHCDVHVASVPQKIRLDMNTDSLSMGSTDTFDLGKRLSLVPADSSSRYVYTSSNRNVAWIDENGIIHAAGYGTATIRVNTYNGLNSLNMNNGGETAAISVFVGNSPSDSEENTKPAVVANVNPIGGNMTGKLSVSFPEGYYSMYTVTSPDGLISFDESTLETVRAGTSATTDTYSFKTETVMTATESKITVAGVNGDWSVEYPVTILPGPSTADLNAEDINVPQNETDHSVIVINNNAGSMCSYTYSSDNNEIVEIDEENGTVIPKHSGKAVITVSSNNSDAVIQCTVTVEAVPLVIDFDDLQNVLMTNGDTISMPVPTVFDYSGDEWEGEIVYTSAPAGIISVDDQTGKITALKAGAATVTAVLYNGVTAEYSVTVSNQAIMAVQLFSSSEDLYIGPDGYTETVQLGGIVMIGGESGYGSLAFTSEDSSVAEVDAQSGEVTAIGVGSTLIKATAYGGAEAYCTVNVYSLPETLVLESTSGTVNEGQSINIVPVYGENEGARLLFESSDSCVAYVDEKGSVTGISGGTAVISVHGQLDLNAQFEVTVVPGPTGIFLPMTEVAMCVNETIQVPYTLTHEAEEYCNDIIWDTSDGYIATVTENGVLEAHEVGEVTVTATTCNNHSASFIVEIYPENSVLTEGFAWKSASIIKGDTIQIPIVFTAEMVDKDISIEIAEGSASSVEKRDESWYLIAGETEEETTLVMTISDADSLDTKSIECDISVIDASKIQLGYSEEVNVEDGNAKFYIRPEAEKTFTYKLAWPLDLVSNLEFTGNSSLFSINVTANGTTPGHEDRNGTVTVTSSESIGSGIILLNGAKCITVTIKTPVYRALIIGEYAKSTDASYLPFATNNMTAVYNALKRSNVDGQTYSITMLTDPSADEIRKGFTKAFGNTTDEDISVVYIVAHGYYNSGRYSFGLGVNKGYMYSDEIMCLLNGISGNVVFIMDSCKSGGFIVNCGAEVRKNGRISVVTAQNEKFNGSFYNGASNSTRIEFMTYVFAEGIGITEGTNAVTNLKAAVSGTNTVTVGGAIRYVVKNTYPLVQKTYKNSSLRPKFQVAAYSAGVWPSGWTQIPQMILADNADELILVQR